MPKFSEGIRRQARAVVPPAVRRRLRPPAPPWVIAQAPPPAPIPLSRFGFNAIIGTWMEADVIADTVANAFAQGVDRVFVVDNCSPDATVEQAVAAGAECVITYATEQYKEQYRIDLMNAFVRYTSELSDHDVVWWLWLDADEFPRPQGEGNLRDLLGRLDRSFRIVGARFINHYPSPGRPGHVRGEHPAHHQELCEELPLNICALGHRKHPLQRWDRSGPLIESGLGFHRAECAERPLLEPTEPIVIHHVPFRNEATTRARLDLLWAGGATEAGRAKQGDIATDHMEARGRSLDAVYAGDWANVYSFMPGAPERGVDLVRWQDLDPPISHELPRWTLAAPDRSIAEPHG